MGPPASRAQSRLTRVWAAKYGIHVILLMAGFLLAYELRRALPLSWWLTNSDSLRVLGWAALYAAIGGGIELVFQAERSAWRFASMREVVGLVRNVTLTCGIFLGVTFFLDRGFQLPRSVLPLAWLMSLALLVGFRIAWRVPHDPALAADFLPRWLHRSAARNKPMLIVGTMEQADRQIRLIRGDPDSAYKITGVITPNTDEVGLRLHGVPFIASVESWAPNQAGLTGRTATSHAIVFLDDPIEAYGFSTERIGELRGAGHTLLKPQRFTDFDDRPSGGQILREISLEEFLPRQPVSLETGPIRRLVQGRRVLVTGAGGSIGSELCRQLADLGCSHLTLLDHSEFLLFEIERELGRSKSNFQRRSVLANVRDQGRLQEVFRRERPDVVFHAAALKHVELVEHNPCEAVLTNVQGTWNVARAAIANGARQFVLISTDKAVAPTSAMGATKRLAEGLLELVQGEGAQLTVVRFGNVLGSAGSVVPIFRDQIARGGPVTVTHPDVNRFFMTIPEAVQLVLHSAAVSSQSAGGMLRKFLLEMGQPVKIVDLARQMIELSGLTPDVDIKIQFSGLKPGEKIAETLHDAGECVRPCVDGIVEVDTASACGLSVEDLSRLIEAAARNDDLAVRSLTFELVEKIRSASLR